MGKKLTYLFSWDEISGNDSWRLIEFLKRNYNIDWVDTAKIEKIDDGIIISAGKKSLSLKLNDEKTMINLIIDDGRTDVFIAKIERGKLNIYKLTKKEEKEFEKLPPGRRVGTGGRVGVGRRVGTGRRP